MLVTVLIWIYTLVTASLVGWACCRLLIKAGQAEIVLPLPFSVQWLLGFAAITTLASFFSLFIPLGLAAQIGVLVLASLAFMILWKPQAVSFRPWLKTAWQGAPVVAVLAILGGATLLLLGTTKPENFDTGLYHAQAIHWIEAYPAVPGLANIHSRLGYNSSWLLTQALYSFAFLGGHSFHLNNSVLFLVAIVYFAAGLRNLWQGSRRFSDWARALFFPLVFYILSSEVSSPGNDAPVALITWIVLGEWLAYFESGHADRDVRPLILTLISVYAVTIKLSAFPLVLIGLTILAGKIFRRNWRMPLLAAGLSALIVLPWMARSVILTGYVLYPFPTLDLFSFDWKIPPQAARLEAQAIQAWARIPGHTLAEVQSMTFRQWTTEWFLNQTLNRRILLLATLAAPLGYFLLGLWKRLRPFLLEIFRPLWPVYLVAYLGLVYWFIAAPDFRFGMGFIISGLVLAIVPIFIFLQEKWKPSAHYFPRILIGLLLVYQVFVFATSLNPKTLGERLVQPADYPSLPTQPCHVGQVTIMVPAEISYQQCWYGVFPCTPDCNPSFVLRGSDWKDGFRPKTSLAAP